MKEKLETRIVELEKLSEEKQRIIQQLVLENNGILHRIDELKLLLKQIEETKS